jgi:hypothetical protein
MIRVVHPGSRILMLTFYPSRIPDPGVKKAPDPGSGSTILHNTIVTAIFLQKWGSIRRNVFSSKRQYSRRHHTIVMASFFQKWDSFRRNVFSYKRQYCRRHYTIVVAYCFRNGIQSGKMCSLINGSIVEDTIR